MRLSLILTMLLTYVMTGVETAHSAGVAVLVAAPYEAHSGDPIYVSGSGLEPNHDETLIIACPNWAGAYANGGDNIAIVPGPRTDANGSFGPYKVNAIPLHGVSSSGCQIYADYRNNEYGPDIPATFTVLAHNQKLDRCAKVICTSIKVGPRPIRPGRRETIVVQPASGHGAGIWPGALVDIAVNVRGMGTLHLHRKLDFQGRATMTIQLGTRIPHPSAGHVQASVHLGPYAGQTGTSFDLLHFSGGSRH